MEYRLRNPVVRIGRSRTNDVVIRHDTRVSRFHAEIRREGGGYVLYDLNSRNGTRVNGQRVNRHVLRSGDVIEIGGVRIPFHQGALILPPGVVAGKGARVATGSLSFSPTIFLGVLAIVLLVGITIWAMTSRKVPAQPDPESLAKLWVAQHPSQIVDELTNRALTLPSVSLEEPVLRDRMSAQIVRPETWRYETLEEITEGVYRVRATTTLSLGLVRPPDVCITASYIFTVDVRQAEVKDYRLERISANEC